MKIFLLILLSSIVAIWADVCIYRRIVRSRRPGRIWRIGYIVYAVVVDTMVVGALAAYNTVLDWQSTAAMRAILWIIGLFFLNAVPKTIYAVVSLGDGLRTKHIGRPSHLFNNLGIVLALVCLIWLAYGMTFGRSVIRVERVELTFDNLPASFDGLRIVEFSDTHYGNVVNGELFLARMCDTINNLQADIVINGGDIVNVHERELTPRVLEILGGIRAGYGVYSVLGNHDLGIYIKDTVVNPPQESVAQLTAKQEALGWTVLRDRTVPLSNGEDTIYITGLDYPEEFYGHSHTSAMNGADITAAYREVPRGAFNLAVTHAPQLWNEMLTAGVGDLTLAGHVHSMQIKLGWGRRRWSPARLFYDCWSGLYEEDGRYLYINDGTGYVMFSMRLGTKPEITLFTLHSGRAVPGPGAPDPSGASATSLSIGSAESRGEPAAEPTAKTDSDNTDDRAGNTPADSASDTPPRRPDEAPFETPDPAEDSGLPELLL
ncbi:MAG: metallophosphoesterase [Rikenellaceae bacterium]|nr:metallophosphoesterase [Rikenellaceae bacterium]